MPRVSVLMAVYNGDRYLDQAIRSILDQTFTDFEFIIVDDASTDGTWEILESFSDPRIRLVRNSQNLKLAKSLNLARSVAGGEFLARMDADDVSLPDRLGRQVDFLIANPHVGLVATNYIELDSAGQINGLPAFSEAPRWPALHWFLLWDNVIAHPTVMLRATAMDECNGYSENYQHYAEDLALWLNLAQRTELAVLDDVLLHLRKHTHNVTRVDTIEHLHEVVTVVQHGLAERIGDSPSRQAVHLVRKIPSAELFTPAHVSEALKLLREGYRAVIRHPDIPTVRTDLGWRTLRICRRYLPQSRLRVFGAYLDVLQIAPRAACSRTGAHTLWQGLLGHHS